MARRRTRLSENKRDPNWREDETVVKGAVWGTLSNVLTAFYML